MEKKIKVHKSRLPQIPKKPRDIPTCLVAQKLDYIFQNSLACTCREGWATGKILRDLFEKRKGSNSYFVAHRHCCWSADWHKAAAKPGIFLPSLGYPFSFSDSWARLCVWLLSRLSSVLRLETDLSFNPVKLQLALVVCSVRMAVFLEWLPCRPQTSVSDQYSLTESA